MRLLLTTAFLGAVGLSPALAADSALTLWNSANPGGAETATGTGSATISGSNLGGITVTTSEVSQVVIGTTNSMTESNITIDNTTGASQTLNIIAGTNGFNGPSNLFTVSGTVLVEIGNATLAGSFFAVPNNTLNGIGVVPVVGTDIGDFNSGLLTGPFSYSDNGSAIFGVSTPYGMTEVLSLTLAPGAIVGVQSISMDATSGVPEPSTWAMGIAGFALLGALGLRKRRVSRFAV